MTKNVIIIVGIVFILIINLIIFPMFGDRLLQVAPNAETIFDLSFYYTPEQAYQKLISYGLEGRRLIPVFSLIDYAYIFIYVTTYYLLLQKLIARSGFPYSKFIFLPFIVGALDLFENISYTVMLRAFPTPSPLIAQFTTVVTMTKWVLAGVIAILGIFLLIKIRRKR